MSFWLRAGILVASIAAAAAAIAQDEEKSEESQTTAQSEPKPRMDVYGHVMLDTGYQSGANDPDWFDVVRPVKLPSFENEFGAEGNWFASVRQTRFGVKNYFPTDIGELRTTFEFELFGTGVDAGQTTFRLRHAYGEIGKFGAGQYWSPFMDIDVFPNSIEYWGPNGMVFFRNVQVRYMPLQGSTSVTVAIERPGASADQGVYADRIELEGVDAKFPMPDLSGNVRKTGEWGHVQVSGIYRRIEWEDLNDDRFDLSGSTNGWGINVSTNYKIEKDTVRASVVYGAGIQNYMNDAPVDVGIENNFQDPTRPIEGKALPLLGIVLFYDRTWSDQWTSSFGYSLVDIDNTDAQESNAFKTGHYALGNLLYYPAPNFFVGGELQWGRRENFNDGWTYDDVRVQFSAKYTFSHRLGGQ
jgi:hypothetical protein